MNPPNKSFTIDGKRQIESVLIRKNNVQLYITHFSLLFQGFPDSILDCRSCDSSNTVHPECWPIPVPKNDPYFPALNTTSGRAHCIAFTRSLPGQQRLGKFRLDALTGIRGGGLSLVT